MRYDVVIATLNRAETLKASLKLIEEQTERPERVIIVDASDDHAGLKRTIEPVMRGSDIHYELCPTDVRNAAYQRNVGLELVQSPVVFLPDDDSMLYPETASEILSAYRADDKGLIGGVAGRAASTAPNIEYLAHQKRPIRAIKERVQPIRNAFEEWAAPKPFNLYPREVWRQSIVPDWIDGERYCLVEVIGGYLMSLRAEPAKRLKFDETLGYGIGYALHEDMDMSMRLYRQGYLLVAAQYGSIYHNVFPSKRAAGFNYGFCQIANYIYACCKTLPRDTDAWRQLPRFMQYKIFLYRLAARHEFGRDVLRGAQTAWDERARLIDSPDEAALKEAYMLLCDRYVKTPAPSAVAA